MAQTRKRLGDLLVEAGMITEEQVKEALNNKKPDQKLGDVLLELGFITEQQLIEVLEFQLGIPHVSLNRYPIDSSVVKLISKDFARRNGLIPLKREGDKLMVAMADPMDYIAVDDLKMATGFQIETAIASKQDIFKAIYKYYDIQESYDQMQVEEGDGADSFLNPNALVDDDDEAPAIRLVNQILLQGLKQQASDIHIDPHEKKVLIRYRVDGMLQTERAIPKSMQNSLIARVKIMANLNITETRLPQDGRVKVSMDGGPVDLRIATLPTVFGEKIVIRILDLNQAITNLSQLGFNSIHFERFRKLLKQPSGMILLTGPTGSGKTSTLYAALNHLNTDDVNIVTVEDPVEYQIEGINQVQVNSDVGLTFATGLRSILRQDPNIVMVGEVRDRETAEIAVRASLTGHLVFSTLHTNNAIATIPRLIDMGVEPFLVMSSLSGIVAQRLVRRICQDCITSYEVTEEERAVFERRGIDVETLYYGQGCPSCQHTGYAGRMAVHEMFLVDDEVRRLVLNHEPMSKVREHALKNDMIFLIEDGLLKAKQAETTLQEVLRIAMDD